MPHELRARGVPLALAPGEEQRKDRGREPDQGPPCRRGTQLLGPFGQDLGQHGQHEVGHGGLRPRAQRVIGRRLPEQDAADPGIVLDDGNCRLEGPGQRCGHAFIHHGGCDDSEDGFADAVDGLVVHRLEEVFAGREQVVEVSRPHRCLPAGGSHRQRRHPPGADQLDPRRDQALSTIGLTGCWGQPLPQPVRLGRGPLNRGACGHGETI
ncbi:hypothetical protein LP418_20170 [Nocardioides sp. B-3]|nr:hypothetical protein [Nocardioides sp. B-3]UUZ58473.1 hypothetical protein LP418_20170 [Nocardioides sp. B-3]